MTYRELPPTSPPYLTPPPPPTSPITHPRLGQRPEFGPSAIFSMGMAAYLVGALKSGMKDGHSPNVEHQTYKKLSAALITCYVKNSESSASTFSTHKGSFNPFIPKSDQCQISPAASPEILHHTVWLGFS